MNDDSTQPPRTHNGTEARRILLEAILVAGVGGALALAGNGLSPRGLALARNYFPGGTNGLVVAPVLASSSNPEHGTNTTALAPSAAQQLREKGLQSVDLAQVERLYHDPLYRQQLIVFVDARNEVDYQKGHIPGAYDLDPYRPEQKLGTVLPVCLAAEKVVVYCTGGDCEDSQFAAVLLRNAGVANSKLFVYVGGITQWMSNDLPREIGGRDSGNIRTPKRTPAKGMVRSAQP